VGSTRIQLSGQSAIGLLREHLDESLKIDDFGFQSSP